MWKKVKMLTAFVCATAWWSLFYPELCFTEETCRLIQTAEARDPKAQEADANMGSTQPEKKDSDGADVGIPDGTGDGLTGILQAGDEEVVISSRFLEWCGENLFDRKE